mmetsp:Transcript_39710/g.126292  ORF Transcript_39710/g.126292 Transcript_39710/m.126292 type:complete len:377 (-) Transcript_39710:313-1443(-)
MIQEACAAVEIQVSQVPPAPPLLQPGGADHGHACKQVREGRVDRRGQHAVEPLRLQHCWLFLAVKPEHVGQDCQGRHNSAGSNDRGQHQGPPNLRGPHACGLNQGWQHGVHHVQVAAESVQCSAARRRLKPADRRAEDPPQHPVMQGPGGPHGASREEPGAGQGQQDCARGGGQPRAHPARGRRACCFDGCRLSAQRLRPLAEQEVRGQASALACKKDKDEARGHAATTAAQPLPPDFRADSARPLHLGLEKLPLGLHHWPTSRWLSGLHHRRAGVHGLHEAPLLQLCLLTAEHGAARQHHKGVSIRATVGPAGGDDARGAPEEVQDDTLPHVGGRRRVERAQRIVQQHELRPAVTGPCHGDALALATADGLPTLP